MSKLGRELLFEESTVNFLKRVAVLKMVRRPQKICGFAGAFMDIHLLDRQNRYPKK